MYETEVKTGPDGIVDVYAYGGDRRSRASKIAAALRALRKSGVQLECFHRSYDEMACFMTRSWLRFRVVGGVCDVCGALWPLAHKTGCGSA